MNPSVIPTSKHRSADYLFPRPESILTKQNTSLFRLARFSPTPVWFNDKALFHLQPNPPGGH